MEIGLGVDPGAGLSFAQQREVARGGAGRLRELLDRGGRGAAGLLRSTVDGVSLGPDTMI